MQFHHVMTHTRRMMVFNVDGYTPEADEIIHMGKWKPDLIMQRLPANTKLVVSFYDLDSTFQLPPTGDQFCWADAGGITHIKVDSPDHSGWGSPLRALGLVVTNGPKLSKRLKEIVRIARYTTSISPSIKWVSNKKDEKHFDGINILSRSFASKMGLKKTHKRGNFRCLIEKGLIKGDAIIISDDQMVAQFGECFDIVAPTINLKHELRTTGWAHSSFNPHHDHSQAMFDVQSVTWMREWLYPRDLMKSTLTTAIDEVLESLRAGNWPEWMVLPEQRAHLDDQASYHELEVAAEAFRHHYLKWQMFGMKAEQSASIMGMAANAFKQRLQSRLDLHDREGNWKPMMWIPLPHAVYGHIMTHEFLMLAGYKIPKGCEDKVFFHVESGSFSMPGKDFSRCFERHGTWDLDDSAKFFIRKDKKTGRIVIVIVRSPNSDGEYSVHEVGNVDEIPLYCQYGEIPEIDLTKAPKYIEAVLKGQKVKGLPAPTRKTSVDFSHDEAKYSIKLQRKNPGVGGVANAMMVYYASLGRSPKHVLDTMGNIVDCVQQTPYMEGFTAIENFTKQMWDEISRYGKVDGFLHLTRVPKKRKGELMKYDGYFTALFSHYRAEVKRYSDESRSIAFAHRHNNPINEIKSIPLVDLPIDAAAKWYRFADGQFSAVLKKYPGNSPAVRSVRTEATRDITRRMVAKLNSMEESEANLLVLAMYRFCITPGDHTEKYGRTDRMLFAPVDEDEESVMDIFLRALVDIGAASTPYLG